MGKVKYSEEMKLQTVNYVLEGGKSATKVSKKLEKELKRKERELADEKEVEAV